jgi:hypothetical protein
MLKMNYVLTHVYLGNEHEESFQLHDEILNNNGNNFYYYTLIFSKKCKIFPKIYS